MLLHCSVCEFSLHPFWFHSGQRDAVRNFEGFDEAGSGLNAAVTGAMITEFLDIVETRPEASFRPENWPRTTHDDPNGVNRWYMVEPTDHVPVAYSGEGKIFAWPENHHADNFWRVVPFFYETGVDSVVMSRLINWCERMWPAGDWDSLRQ